MEKFEAADEQEQAEQEAEGFMTPGSCKRVNSYARWERRETIKEGGSRVNSSWRLAA